MKNPKTIEPEPDPSSPKADSYDQNYDNQFLWGNNVNKEMYRVLRMGGLPLFKALYPNQRKPEELLKNPDRLAEAKEAEAWDKFMGKPENVGLSAAMRHRYAADPRNVMPAQSQEEATFRAEFRKELTAYGAAPVLAEVIQIPVVAEEMPAQEIPVEHTEVA